MKIGVLVPMLLLAISCGKRQATPQQKIAPKLGGKDSNQTTRDPFGQDRSGTVSSHPTCTTSECEAVRVEIEILGDKDPTYGQGLIGQGGKPVNWHVRIKPIKAQRRFGLKLNKQFMLYGIDAKYHSEEQNYMTLSWTPVGASKLEDYVQFKARDMDRCAALSPENSKADCYEMSKDSMFDFPVKVPFFIGSVFEDASSNDQKNPWTGFATCLASGVLQQLGIGDLANDLVTGVVGGMMGGDMMDCRDRDYKAPAPPDHRNTSSTAISNEGDNMPTDKLSKVDCELEGGDFIDGKCLF